MKTAIVFLVLIGGLAAYGKDKKAKSQDDRSQDQITVVAHIAPGGGPVTRFLTTEHYNHSYVYAEHGDGGKLTLIDITDAKQPKLLGDIALPAGSNAASLTAATGNAALVSDTPSAETKATAPQTLRIMNFSDPLHPAVAEEFKGVNAMTRDERSGLILLSNPEGIWILRQHLGEDPAVEKSYEHKVLYGESMYY